MSDERISPSEVEELPDVAVEKRRGISMVWLIPLVAAFIGGWLAYKTITETGPTITITFEDGAGLEAGKTKIKHKSVEVGQVERVDLGKNLRNVRVTAQMGKGAEPHLTENTRFWVVRPRVGLGGISGLETLLSGAYIEVDPRPGKPTLQFTGLEEPPGVTSDEEGTEYTLYAQKLGSIQQGSPIYYRGVSVGRVTGHKFDEEGQGVVIDIFIEAPHDQRVRESSRFWKASGMNVSIGAEGIDVQMESLVTLIAGGITFDTPISDPKKSKPSQPGSQFELFESFASIGESKLTKKTPYVLYFDGSVRGLQIGAPVEFRGIKVGTVTDIKVSVNPRTLDIRIPVSIHMEPQRWASPEFIKMGAKARNPYEFSEKLVKRGLRAQLQTGSLLTGQLFVDLDFYPDLPAKTISYEGKYPEIPTVPSTMDEFRHTATSLMQKFRDLPLDQIAHELLETVEGANRFANSPELNEALVSLNKILTDVEKVTGNLDRKVGPLLTSTEKTLASARASIRVVDPNSPVMVDLANLIKELSGAARSLRILADYLERHPEALIHGKGGGR